MAGIYSVWASGAAAQLATPAAEKQELGWIAEIPPFQFFNWHMNRTDSRLSELESPSVNNTVVSLSRMTDIATTEPFTVPQYVVGSGKLKVYIEGICCISGAQGSYTESGAVGSLSTVIYFNQVIPKKYSIVATSLTSASAGVNSYIRYDGDITSVTAHNVYDIKPTSNENRIYNLSSSCDFNVYPAPTGYTKRSFILLRNLSSAVSSVHAVIFKEKRETGDTSTGNFMEGLAAGTSLDLTTSTGGDGAKFIQVDVPATTEYLIEIVHIGGNVYVRRGF